MCAAHIVLANIMCAGHTRLGCTQYVCHTNMRQHIIVGHNCVWHKIVWAISRLGSKMGSAHLVAQEACGTQDL